MATVKGTWKFNDELIAPAADIIEENINFTVNVDYSFFGTRITYVGICNGFEIYPEYTNLLNYIVVDSDPADIGLSFPTKVSPYSANGGWDSIYDETIRTITFASEQEVSDDFYAWFTANAVCLDVPPVVTITYNGTTIAYLIGRDSATLKCAGMKMDGDVVVDVAEIPETFEPSGTITITENGEHIVYDFEKAIVNVPATVVEGTKIPIGTWVGTIYFNTGNTVAETNELLGRLTYVQTPLLPRPIYPIFAYTSDGVTGVFIFAVDMGGGEYNITWASDLSGSSYVDIFQGQIDNVNNGFIMMGVGGITALFNGFNINFSSLSDFSGLAVGSENEKIKNVMSITPFVV